MDSDVLNHAEKEQFQQVKRTMDDTTAQDGVQDLMKLLYRHYGKKVIILLDEYDTPMQEAYVGGYWEEMVSFMRALFNSTFKSNPYLERAVMTGITNFLDEGILKPYWANTSSNALAGSLIRQGDKNIKIQFEDLLSGRTIETWIDEEIVFHQLGDCGDAVWSLLLAAGYLKIVTLKENTYELALTNYEVMRTFERMVLNWIAERGTYYNDFVKSLLRDDTEEMNEYMSLMAKAMFSSFDFIDKPLLCGEKNALRFFEARAFQPGFFDGGTHPSEATHPERFYHGFVLGLLVDLADRYEVTSNRESGFGRYDVMLRPKNKEDNGIILEFKIFNPKKESTLEETVQAALRQIEEKKYEQVLLDSSVSRENIRKYGFAFKGQTVLIG